MTPNWKSHLLKNEKKKKKMIELGTEFYALQRDMVSFSFPLLFSVNGP